ncbi:MAG: hypothetical protein DBX55_06595 [Verrucomicrobia bacterium]|nr:MAG: hypothetical protein DBX55_06595 [Verrucomicrobiota bacterium]
MISRGVEVFLRKDVRRIFCASLCLRQFALMAIRVCGKLRSRAWGNMENAVLQLYSPRNWNFWRFFRPRARAGLRFAVFCAWETKIAGQGFLPL